MPTIFSRIIAGEIPCHKIAENEHCFAFLDISPVAEGHVLVVPKQETDYLFDLDNTIYTELMIFCKSLAPAIQQAIPCLRIGVTVIGLEVPHVHVHLIPLNSMHDMDFSKPKLQISQDALADTAKRIRSFVK
ncbi:HIT family protein [Xanthocytophaga flava]|uniref:HIT family protein n=1 Tax=Xanthocytophaga flava TaxID=3048013 RepID=UPI0028D5F1D4|nr:HIT family protein [Xanthocytophaga flavus]MDJ1470677.1 HIT family protein [Xanthocytophaga flavus]